MRTKIILILAIIMGLITTLLFYKYMMQFDQEIIVHETMVEVLVARNEIPKNQRITADHIEKVSLTQAGIHPQALKDSSDIVGKYTTSDIIAGEQILSHRLSHEKEERLFISRKVKEGHRVVSIGVNFVQTVSNLIEPGDLIDVIFTVKDPNPNPDSESNSDELVSEILLEQVHVLAVGRRMIETRPDDVYVEYSSASLELLPQDAVKLVNATQRGSIHLILHSRIKEQEGE